MIPTPSFVVEAGALGSTYYGSFALVLTGQKAVTVAAPTLSFLGSDGSAIKIEATEDASFPMTMAEGQTQKINYTIPMPKALLSGVQRDQLCNGKIEIVADVLDQTIESDSFSATCE